MRGGKSDTVVFIVYIVTRDVAHSDQTSNRGVTLHRGNQVVLRERVGMRAVCPLGATRGFAPGRRVVASQVIRNTGHLGVDLFRLFFRGMTNGLFVAERTLVLVSLISLVWSVYEFAYFHKICTSAIRTCHSQRPRLRSVLRYLAAFQSHVARRLDVDVAAAVEGNVVTLDSNCSILFKRDARRTRLQNDLLIRGK